MNGGERVIRVVAPHFVAALVLQYDICIDAAPILYRLTIGLTYEAIAALIRSRGWREDNPKGHRHDD